MADIEAKTSEQLPKMKVVFCIKNAFLERSGSSGRKQLTADCIILESDIGEEFVNKKYTKRWGLETEENIQWLKKDMNALELPEPKTPKDILSLAGALVGICFNGQLVPNTDESFPPNCFINKGARRHELEETSDSSDTGSNELG
jgi:hypothetical protein